MDDDFTVPLRRSPGFICLPDDLFCDNFGKKFSLICLTPGGIFCSLPSNKELLNICPFSKSQQKILNRWYNRYYRYPQKETPDNKIGQLHFYLKDGNYSLHTSICLRIDWFDNENCYEFLIVELTFDSASQLLKRLEAESKVNSLIFYLENGKIIS